MRGRRFGSAVQYHLWSDSRGLRLYYLLILVANLVIGLFSRRAGSAWGGLEAASVIYLFVCGLHAFRERFYLFLQHGFSRRTLVGSFCLSALVFCLGMALADSLLWLLNSQWSQVQSLFQQVYAARDYTVSLMSFFLTLVWNFSLYLFAYLLGYCLTCLYYPMSRPVKYLVSVVVPALLLLGLPLLDSATAGASGRALGEFGFWVLYGGQGFCPWCGVRSFLVGAAVLALLSFLLVRRATVKKDV